jgi:hypothetical protein
LDVNGLDFKPIIMDSRPKRLDAHFNLYQAKQDPSPTAEINSVIVQQGKLPPYLSMYLIRLTRVRPSYGGLD